MTVCVIKATALGVRARQQGVNGGLLGGGQIAPTNDTQESLDFSRKLACRLFPCRFVTDAKRRKQGQDEEDARQHGGHLSER